MDNNSLAHTKWNCKYHIVFTPKYRRQIIYKQISSDIGQIIRMLCARKGIEIIEAAAMPDHIHLYVTIPPEVQRIRSSRVSQREEQLNDIRPACESEVQVWESAFLVQRVLCGYGRTE